MAISKVILNNVTQMDVTQVTATADKVLDGYTAIGNDGTPITGTYTPPAPSMQSKSKSYTPSETAQSETVTPDNGYDGLSQVSVSVSAISSSYVGSAVTRRSSSDLSASGATVTVPSGYYSAQATKSVASGTTGTPVATKGTVSNHSVNVTPSVTNTAGYISGGTVNGTAVSVSASELVSGNKAITENGTGIDVADYATVSVDVSGGGANIGTGSVSNSSATATLLSFTGLQGEPLAFFVRVTTTITSSGSTSYYYVASMRYNGTNTNGTYMRIGSTRGIYNDTSHYSYTYSNGTLQVMSSASRTAAGGSFYNGTYELTYVY